MRKLAFSERFTPKIQHPYLNVIKSLPIRYIFPTYLLFFPTYLLFFPTYPLYFPYLSVIFGIVTI